MTAAPSVPPPGQALVLSVFAAGPGGGNPTSIVVDAAGMSGDAMRDLAVRHGHESAFVLPGDEGHDLRLRFFVPEHEMEMCGHATVGTTWLLGRLGLLRSDSISIATLSGPVTARPDRDGASVSQPVGRCRRVDDPALLLDVLGVRPGDLLDLPVLNAVTSRVKTLVPLRSVELLDALAPDFARMMAACDAVGSTGLYPFAVCGPAVFAARQFPRGSGYPEDAATGVAAAALAWGIRELGLSSADAIAVRQGEAMGRPSEIRVAIEADRCWISGRAALVGGPMA